MFQILLINMPPKTCTVFSYKNISHKMLFRAYHNIYNGLILKWNYQGVCICNSMQYTVKQCKRQLLFSSFFFSSFFISFNNIFFGHLLCARHFDRFGRITNNKTKKVTDLKDRKHQSREGCEGRSPKVVISSSKSIHTTLLW